VLRLPGAGGTDAVHDDVIWVTQGSPGLGQMLNVVHSPGGTFEPPIYSGTIIAAHLTLADLDADGSQDLVITRSDEHTSFVLFRQHTGASFGFFSEQNQNPLGFDLGAVSGSCAGSPAVGAGDLDGDGDEDVLYAGQPGCADLAQVCFANGIDEECQVIGTPSELVKPWVSHVDFHNWIYPEVPGPGVEDEVHMTFYPWALPLAPAVSSASHLRVTVWGRMDDPGDITPVRLSDNFYSRTSPMFTVDVPLPPHAESGLPQYLVIELSYVVCDGVPEVDHVVQSFPAWTGQIDRFLGIQDDGDAGGGTTGGIDRPPPPPSGTPPSP
jgi:hypothetical protein